MDIETDVDLPKRRAGRPPRDPWEKLGVGDSFFVAASWDEYDAVSNKVRASAWNWGKPRGIRFASRRVEGGVRIWRVE